jgi:hypothetical protein
VSRLAALALALSACVTAGDTDRSQACVAVETNSFGTHEEVTSFVAPGQPRELRMSEDGKLRARWTYEYDAEGRRTAELADVLGPRGAPDGVTDGVIRYEHLPTETVVTSFDVDGDVLTLQSMTRTTIGPGDFVVRADQAGSSVVYQFDENLRVVRIEDKGTTIDGPYETHESFAYDEEGRIISRRTEDLETGLTSDQTWAYEASPGQLVITIASGMTANRLTYQYDDDHRLVALLDDSGADGATDSRSDIAYDAEGNAALTFTTFDPGLAPRTGTASAACKPSEPQLVPWAVPRPGTRWRPKGLKLPSLYL